VVANGDLVISLGYNPTSGFPATLPATVTIPNGQNEGEFTVQAFPTALDGTSLKITLTATDSQYVTCENTEIDLEIGRKRYAIPVNPSTRFRIK
ncbi:MAG: hypothetical protein LBU22_12095, partial [Dysgonamonadaceae bacterium]|nr:hypothetical protein [Dysgonamonadaceae bacterium]